VIPEIDRLFGSKTRVAILNRLMLESDREFYIRELAKLLGTAFSVVYRELKNLKDLGLVREEKRGKLRFFRINKSSIIYEDLRHIFLKAKFFGKNI